MSTSFALATYFVCWWIVLFAVLPLKIGKQPKDGERDSFAEAAGAPSAPNLGIKFLLTTLIAALVFAGIYAIVTFGLVSLDDFPF
jgi:predicted secreted protein